MTAATGAGHRVAAGAGWRAAPAPRRAAPLAAVDSYRAEPGTAGAVRVSARTRIGREPETLRGHFPRLPIYPGVFVLETLTQAVDAAVGGRAPLRLARVDSVRFHAALRPGDQLLLEATAEPVSDPAGWRVVARGSDDAGRAVATVTALLRPVPWVDAAVSADPVPAEPVPADPGDPGGVLDHAALRRLLPHRHPMLLLDRAWLPEPDTIVAEKAITATEPCYGVLDGRDEPWPPGAWAYPVSLQLESLGQAAAVLWLAGSGAPVTGGEVLMFAAMRGYTITAAAHPGQLLRHQVSLTHVKAGTAFATGRSWAAGRLVATVETLIAVRRPRTVAEPAPTPPTTAEEAGR